MWILIFTVNITFFKCLVPVLIVFCTKYSGVFEISPFAYDLDSFAVLVFLCLTV